MADGSAPDSSHSPNSTASTSSGRVKWMAKVVAIWRAAQRRQLAVPQHQHGAQDQRHRAGQHIEPAMGAHASAGICSPPLASSSSSMQIDHGQARAARQDVGILDGMHQHARRQLQMPLGPEKKKASPE